MATKVKSPGLTLQYDRVGDILYLEKCAPYPEQESEEVRDGVIARLNPNTGAVESLEVLFFSTRLSNKKQLELPVTADLRLLFQPKGAPAGQGG